MANDTKISALIASGLAPLASIPNTYLPLFAGGIATSIAAKFAQMVSVLDFGADPTGTVDSSAAFQLACNAGTFVYVPPPNAGKQYIVHDVTIPGGVTVFAYGAYFKDAVGAAFVFKLTGFATKLLGAYISTSLNCSVATIIVDNGKACTLSDIHVINAVNCFRVQATGGDYSNQTKVTNCYGNNFSGIGFYHGPNCSELRAVNTYIDANQVAGTGGLIPRAGTTSFYFDGTGSTFAYGGNYLTQCQASNSQDGFYAKNSNLLEFSGCTADNNSARGFAFDGNTNLVTLIGSNTGPAAVGVWTGGTATQIWATGMTTINNGVIPPGGGSNWYTSYTPAYNGFTFGGTYTDIQAAGTSNIAVDAASWLASQGTAHSYIVAAGAILAFPGALQLNFNSVTTVAAASTVYLGPTGQTAVDGTLIWVAPYNCIVQEFRVNFNVNPGAGTYTYTLRVNGSSTALTGNVTGAPFSFEVRNGTQVGIAKGQQITLQLVTSAGSGVAFHSGYLMLLPQP